MMEIKLRRPNTSGESFTILGWEFELRPGCYHDAFKIVVFNIEFIWYR